MVSRSVVTLALAAARTTLSLPSARSAGSAQGTRDSGSRSPRPSLGILVGPASDAEQEGVKVHQVVPGSPAAKAGLKKGDVITRVEGREMDHPDTLLNVLAKHKPGEELTFHVLRDGQEKSLKVRLGES